MIPWRYESDDGIPLEVDVPEGQRPPARVRHEGREYFPAWEGADVAAIRRELGMVLNVPARPSLRDGRFESRSLPRWDPHHRGEFSPDGKPRFESRSQAHEYARRVSGETNMDTKYGEL